MPNQTTAPAAHHLNVHDRPAPCHATVRACPLKEVTAHFATKEEAEKESARRIEAKINWQPLTKEEHYKEQVNLYYEYENRYGYRIAKDPNAAKHFASGFEDGQKYSVIGKPDSGDLYEYIRGRGEDVTTAYYAGAMRGLVTELDVDEKEYIRHSGGYYFHGVSAEEARKIRRTRILHNPFKEGDEVFIPAGTPYNNGDTGAKLGLTKRATKIRVERMYQGSSDASVGKISLTPPTLYADPWRHYVLTPEVLRANQKEVFDQPHMHESKLREVKPGNNPLL